MATKRLNAVRRPQAAAQPSAAPGGSPGATGPLPRIMVVAGSAGSSKLIEDFGGWSHMANILADDTILDARSDAMTFPPPWGAIDPGVRLRPPGYLKAENKRWAIYEFGMPEMYGPWRHAGLEQVGKLYDKDGIWQFVVGLFSGRHRDRNYNRADPSKSRAWFCDALSVYMAAACGFLKLPTDFSPYDQTPGAALNLFIGAGARCIASRG